MTNKNSDAILLLTAQFSDSATSALRPLDLDEWHKVSTFLETNQSKGLLPGKPQDLFKMDEEALERLESGTGIARERILNLLDRGSGLAIMRAKWESAGLWCLTVEDEDYPEMWKKDAPLAAISPPVIYGSGNKHVMKEKLVGMLGELSKYPKNLASYLHSKGVITIAPLPSENQSANLPSIGIVRTNLLQEATSVKFRNLIQDEKLTLISFYSPEVVISDKELEKSHDLFKSLSASYVTMEKNKLGNISGNTWAYVRGFVNQEGKYIGLQECLALISQDEGQKNSINFRQTSTDNSENQSEWGRLNSQNTINKEFTKTTTKSESSELTEEKSNENKKDAIISAKRESENQFLEEPGNLLPLELMQSSDLKIKQIDKFSKFLLGFLESKTSLKSFQSEASSEFLTKAALSKWLKKAVQKGIVKEIRIKRKKFYQSNY